MVGFVVYVFIHYKMQAIEQLSANYSFELSLLWNGLLRQRCRKKKKNTVEEVWAFSFLSLGFWGFVKWEEVKQAYSPSFLKLTGFKGLEKLLYCGKKCFGYAILNHNSGNTWVGVLEDMLFNISLYSRSIIIVIGKVTLVFILGCRPVWRTHVAAIEAEFWSGSSTLIQENSWIEVGEGD